MQYLAVINVQFIDVMDEFHVYRYSNDLIFTKINNKKDLKQFVSSHHQANF